MKDARIRQLSVKIPDKKPVGVIVKPNFTAASKKSKNMTIINPILSITKHGTIKKEQLLNIGKSMVAKAKK